MEKIPRQFYTAEFKEEAVKLVTEGRLTIAEASRRLGLSEQTLRNWLKLLKAGRPVAGSRDVTELEAEVSKLRRQLAEARMERDILKKAMAYLAIEAIIDDIQRVISRRIGVARSLNLLFS